MEPTVSIVGEDVLVFEWEYATFHRLRSYAAK